MKVAIKSLFQKTHQKLLKMIFFEVVEKSLDTLAVGDERPLAGVAVADDAVVEVVVVVPVVLVADVKVGRADRFEVFVGLFVVAFIKV